MRFWRLLVHGGAGSMTPGLLSQGDEDRARKALRLALSDGGALLGKGCGALDAVERAVQVLEDDPIFNAGRGSVFTWDGSIECDAAIMDGRSLEAGGVAGSTAQTSSHAK